MHVDTRANALGPAIMVGGMCLAIALFFCVPPRKDDDRERRRRRRRRATTTSDDDDDDLQLRQLLARARLLYV